MTETEQIGGRADEVASKEGVSDRDITELIELVEDGQGDAVGDMIGRPHPADAADLLENIPRHALSDLSELLGKEFPADVLIEMRDEYRAAVVEALPDEAVRDALIELDSDDAALIFDDVDDRRQSAVLEALSDLDRRELELSLAFDDETAGRLMQREFVAAPEFWSVGHAVDHARDHAADLPEIFFEIYVIDPAFRVRGSVPLHDLLRTSRDTLLSDIASPIKAKVTPDMDQEDVAYMFQKYDLTSVPVVDESERLTGMITVDDMMDVIQEENREDLLALSGVSSSTAYETVWSTVQSRAPWLAMNVATAFLASAVVSMFADTIDSIVALAILMPVVVALGGNAGSQTLAVSVRGIAERDLTGGAAKRAIMRELMTGFINGLLFASVVAVIALVWFQSPMLAIVIWVAMMLTFLWAGLSGILIPLTLKRLGADPAVASSVFLLTTVDVIGFLTFLGLATFFLL